MGRSFTILEKDLTLSIEVDRSVSIELGTGWGRCEKKSHVSVQMDITLPELGELIENLKIVQKDLVGCKLCSQCGTINHRESSECEICEDLLGTNDDLQEREL